MESKFNEAPRLTKSMRIALDDLSLEHLWVVHPGTHSFPLAANATAWPIRDIPALPAAIAGQT